MEQSNSKLVSELSEAVARCLPRLSAEEQRAGIALFRELAEGEPVVIGQLTAALGASVATVDALVKQSTLRRFIHEDGDGRIQGFWGLSVTPTRHQLTVNGRALWAWCAQDSLFIPELLAAAAKVASQDPVTGQPIRLTVAPERIEAAQPAGIMVSIGRPETWDATSANRIMATACHFIFFFASRASAERWQAKHPKMILLSLEEAFAFGKCANAYRFGAELRRQRAAKQAETLT